ncbi:MAG: YbaK/EbsC family protein [Chloroflexi bacterium]|nr:YbaK/EbsC family protein [Chloroflexota bacterium]
MKNTTHPTALRVQEIGRDLGLEITVVEFSESTRTAPEAAHAVGCHVGQIVKSLVFVVAGKPVICLVSGDNRLDERKLARWAGVGRKKVKRANAETVRQATGFAIGGVAPFGYPHALPLLFDQDLLRYEVVWAAAGTPNTVFAVPPQDLAKAIQAEVLDLCQSSPNL